MKPRDTYVLANVLVGGKRHSGSATGTDERDALRRFVARKARELGVDVAAAIVGAKTGYRCSKQKPAPAVQAAADTLLPPAARDWSDWPAMKGPRVR